MPASYSEHPTFYLRILLFVSAAVGITLSAIVWSLEPRDGTDLVVPMTLLFISALASMAALTNSFVSTNEHDNDPVLPSRIYLVIDSVIAFLLHGTFWLVSFVSFFLYLLTSRIILAYSALPLLVSSYVEPTFVLYVILTASQYSAFYMLLEGTHHQRASPMASRSAQFPLLCFWSGTKYRGSSTVSAGTSLRR